MKKFGIYFTKNKGEFSHISPIKHYVIYRAKNRIPYFVFRIDGKFCIELYSQSIVIPIEKLYLTPNKKLLYKDEEFVCHCAIENDNFVDFIKSLERFLNYDFFETNFYLFISAWERWYYII